MGNIQSQNMDILKKIDQIRAQIEGLRPFNEDLQKTLQDQLRVEWTYNSNAIEGNSLTLGETAFFLREGLTSEGKPLQDYFEAKNHAEAIDKLQEIISNKQLITEHLIKSLHSVLMNGADKEIHVGEYKKQPNHVLTLSGKIHKYVDPIHVHDEMESLLQWLASEKKIHPVERAAQFHYKFVSIHPFDDGNGRMSRLLMNLLLMQAGYYPCVIQNAHRRRYIQVLEQVDSLKDMSLFTNFVAQELLATEEKVLDIVEGRGVALSQPTTILNSIERKGRVLHVLRIAPQPLSIGQIAELLPEIKRPTLKKDLQDLVDKRTIRRQGKGRSVLYKIN